MIMVMWFYTNHNKFVRSIWEGFVVSTPRIKSYNPLISLYTTVANKELTGIHLRFNKVSIKAAVLTQTRPGHKTKVSSKHISIYIVLMKFHTEIQYFSFMLFISDCNFHTKTTFDLHVNV